MKKQNYNSYLQSTNLIQSKDRSILEAVRIVIGNSISKNEIARKLFYFIRDDIRYQFIPQFDEINHLASKILSRRRGYCTQKAILFCSMARAAGIPAGIHFFDIIDHALPPRSKEILKTNRLYHHGITSLHLEDNWIKFDATLDLKLCQRNGLKPVEFAENHDCLMPTTTIKGHPHIEYVEDFGLYHDVAFEDILNWFKSGYPHMF